MQRITYPKPQSVQTSLCDIRGRLLTSTKDEPANANTRNSASRNANTIRLQRGIQLLPLQPCAELHRLRDLVVLDGCERRRGDVDALGGREERTSGVASPHDLSLGLKGQNESFTRRENGGLRQKAFWFSQRFEAEEGESRKLQTVQGRCFRTHNLPNILGGMRLDHACRNLVTGARPMLTELLKALTT